jgi:hypothetical protein
MVNLVFALGALMIVWGLFILATGDYVATLDIAAGVIGTGVVVVALGAIIRSVDSLRRALPLRWDAALPATPSGPSAEEHRPEPVMPSAPMAMKPEPAAAMPVLAAVSTTVTEEAVISSPPSRARQPSSPVVHREPEKVPAVEAPPALPVPSAGLADDVQNAEAPERNLVREGEIDGRVYRFYSDGSIEAEDEQGVEHYASMAEAREHIIRIREERIRADQEQSAAAPPRVEAETDQASAPLVQERAPDKPARVESAPASPSPRTTEERSANWQNYLSSGRNTAPDVRPAQDATGSRVESAPPVTSPDAAPTGPDLGVAPVAPVAPRPSDRLSASDQNWSDSFRQLLKKSSGPQGGGGAS